MHCYAELISMALTFPTVVLGVKTAMEFAPAAFSALRHGPKYFDRLDWIILGVALGFVGGSLDNIYWAIPWTNAYLNAGEGGPTDCVLMNTGVFFNIPFRQVAGTWAAYCHLRSKAESGDDADSRKAKLKRLTINSHLAGVLYAGLLWSIKNWR